MSLFGNFGRRIIEAREKQVRGQVYATLLSFDDETIARSGFTRAQLKREATSPYLF